MSSKSISVINCVWLFASLVFNIHYLKAMQHNKIEEGDFRKLTHRINKVSYESAVKDRIFDDVCANAYMGLKNKPELFGFLTNERMSDYVCKTPASFASHQEWQNYMKKQKEKIQQQNEKRNQIFSLMRNSRGERPLSENDERICYAHLKYIACNGWQGYVNMRLPITTSKY